MATIRIDISSENRARQELQRTQQQIVGLNEQIARNNRLIVSAEGDRRRALQQDNARIRAERGLLAVQRQRLNASLPGLRQEVRAIGDATRGTNGLARASNLLGGTLAALGFGQLASEVVDFTRQSIQAGVQVEGFRNSLQALYGSAEVGNRVFQQLNELAELPGITLEGAVQGAIRLKTVNVEGEQALNVIREFGNAAALAGSTSEEMGRALVGLTQTLSRGQIEQDNLNQILENVPLIGQAIQRSFNSIDAENIRSQLDAAGQSTQDFVDILINELGQGARASAESTANAISNLRNATFRLQAEIGTALTPVLRDAITNLTDFLNAARQGVSDISSLPEPIQALVRGVQDLYEGFLAVAENIRQGLGPEINQLLPVVGNLLGNILSLAGALADALAPAYQIVAIPTRIVIALVVHLADTIGNVIGAITEFVNFAAFWRDSQDQVSTSTQNLSESVGAATAALGDNATAVERNQARLTDLQTQLDSVNSQLDAKRRRYQELTDRGVNPATASMQQLERQINGLETQSASLTTQIDAATMSTQESTTATQASTTATQEAEVAVRSYAEIIQGLQESVRTTAEENRALADVLRDQNTFWQVAAGGVDALNTNLETLVPTIVDTEAEISALDAAFNANITTLETYTGEAQELIDAYGGLSDGLTSFAADQAIATAEINLANPAINAAAESVRNYVDELDSLDVQYQSVDAISRDVTDSIRQQGTAFDDLRSNVESTQDPFSEFEDTIEAIPENVDLINDAFEVFNRDTLRGVLQVSNALGDLEGAIGSVGSALGDFARFGLDPVGFSIGFIAETVGDLIDQLDGFEGTFQSPTLQRLIDLDVQREDPNLANVRSILQRPEGLDFITQNYQGLLADPNVEALIRELRPDQAGRLFDQEGLGSGRVVRFDPILRESLADLLAPGSEAGAPLGSRDPTAPLSEINETLRSIDEKTPDTGSIRNVSLGSDLPSQFTSIDRIFGDPEAAEAQAQVSADAILMINEDLADRREAINDRLNDQLGRLAQDAVDAERDKLRQIEDLNIRHARSLERLRLGSSRRIEDIDIDLQRRIEDINIDAQRRIADVNENPRFADDPARRAREIAEIQERQQERIADAQLRAARDRADVQLRSQRAVDDLATQTAERIADRELQATRLQTSILESQQNARLQADTAHQQAQQEAQRVFDTEVQEAIAAAQVARQETQRAFETQLQETIAAAQEAERNARHERQLASTEQVEGISNTNLGTRLDQEMASTLTNVGIQDSHLGGRLNRELTSTLEIENIKDERHANRLQLEQMALETLRAMDEIAFTPSAEQLNRLPNQDTGGANALYRDLSDIDYARQVLADRADLNARRQAAFAALPRATEQQQIDADRADLAARRAAARAQRITVEVPVIMDSREVARAVSPEIVIEQEIGTLTS